VGGLANQVTEDDLWKAFGKCGQIRDIRVPGKGRFSDHSKPSGIAFIEYETREEAKWAVQDMNGALLKGRTVRVSISGKK